MTGPRIGLSMLFCLGKPFENMIDELLKAKSPVVEVVDDGLHALNKRRISALTDIAKTRSLEYSVHAPFSDINIASPSEFMLNAMLRRIEKSIENASLLEAQRWIFHPGMTTGLSMFYPGMDWRQNLASTRTIAHIAADYGVEIAIENVPEPHPFLMKSVEDFQRFYREIGEDIHLALDIGHANINDQIEGFLKTFPDKIVHIHVSDNDGKQDMHLGVGSGTVNWKNTALLLKKIDYKGAMVIESVEHVEESRKYLEKLFNQF